MDKQQAAFDTICQMISRRTGVTKEQLTRDTKFASIPGLDMMSFMEICTIQFRKTVVVNSTTKCTIGDFVDQVAR